MTVLKGDSDFPEVPKSLVDCLDVLFPERSAELSWTANEVWYKAGARSVVRFLKQKYEEQTTGN